MVRRPARVTPGRTRYSPIMTRTRSNTSASASASASARPPPVRRSQRLPVREPIQTRARNRARDTDDVRLSSRGIAHSADELIHVRAIRSLFREDARGHSGPIFDDPDKTARVASGLERLTYRGNLERTDIGIPAGYSVDIPRDLLSGIPGERHSRLYASSYVSLFNALAAELRRPGVRRTNAFLPYSASVMDGSRGPVLRTPLRVYRSIGELREHFWADIRRKIRYLYSGLAGDSDRDSFTFQEFDTGVSFLDNPEGIDIYSSTSLSGGSCNKKKTTYPILKGKFSDYRVMNPASSGSNCGLHCLIAANKNVPSVKTIRRTFNLPANQPVSDVKLVEIGSRYGLRVKVFTDNSNEEDLWDSLTSGYTCVYLDDSHYKLVMAKTSFYTCPVCKRKLRSKECDELIPHECNLKRVTNLSNHPNVKVDRFDAAYDIETRNDIRNLREYDIGLLQNPADESARVFVLPQVPTLICMVFKNESVLVRNSFLGVECMDQFLDRLYELHSNYIYLDLYAHNGSRFDALLVLQAIKANEKYAKYTNMDEAVIKGTRVLSFKFMNHTFRGTENYLEGSLEKLCKSFKIEDAKKKKIIIYGDEWDTMDLCLMNPEQSPLEFIDFITNPKYEEFQKAYVEYCLYDCISLLEVWTRFKSQMLEYVIPVRDYPFLKGVFSKSATLPGTIMRVFKAVHSKKIEGANGNGKSTHILSYWRPTSRNPTVSKLILDAKLGGISHVAKPGLHIGSISMVDVKSLYPSVMLANEYPDGEPIELLGDAECRSFIHADYLAIIRCSEVKMNTNCIADYPARTPGGLDWGATYVKDGALTSIDILRILRHGGTVTMEWGIGWTKRTNPFIPVISKATAIKVEQDHFAETNDSRYNPVLRTATKLTGNALFGKMLESSKNSSWEEFDSFFDYSEYDPDGKYDVRQSNGKFYVKVPEDTEILPPLQFGVFILAHSRQVMQHYFDMVGRHNVIASETDSIHCFSKHLLTLKQSNDPLYRIGTEYGNMVAEHDGTIRKAYFLAKKCYAYIEMKEGCKEEKKMKCKGISTKCLTPFFFETLYTTRSAKVENMKVFKRNLFSDVHTGVTIEYLTKIIKTNPNMEYKEYNDC